MASFRRSVRVHSPPSPNLPFVPRDQDDAKGGGMWRVSRALISVALETEEEHLHAIIAGWPATAESHQRTATKATESHTLGRHVSRRLTANPFSIWLPESSVWPASHSTWAQHGHPAPGHSDWGQRRITEHRFTTPRHVGTLYLTNKHTLRGLYCTPLVVWFFSPLQYIYIYIYTL